MRKKSQGNTKCPGGISSGSFSLGEKVGDDKLGFEDGGNAVGVCDGFPLGFSDGVSVGLLEGLFDGMLEGT